MNEPICPDCEALCEVYQPRGWWPHHLVVCSRVECGSEFVDAELENGSRRWWKFGTVVRQSKDLPR